MPLDLIGIIMDNMDIIMNFLGPTVIELASMAVDAAQAIPVVGAVVTAVWLYIAPMRKPLETVLTNGIDIVDMFINIARKNYGLAYMSALNGIPMFSDIVDSIVNIMYVMNKYLNRANPVLSKVNEVSSKFNNMFGLFNSNIKNFMPALNIMMRDPRIMVDPVMFIKQIIIPNKQFIPVLQPFTTEMLLQYTKLLEPGLRKLQENPFLYIADLNKIYWDIIVPFQDQVPELRFLGRNQMLTYLYQIMNSSLSYINPYLRESNRYMVNFKPYSY